MTFEDEEGICKNCGLNPSTNCGFGEIVWISDTDFYNDEGMLNENGHYEYVCKHPDHKVDCPCEQEFCSECKAEWL
jgi:hypothetical protein